MRLQLITLTKEISISGGATPGRAGKNAFAEIIMSALAAVLRVKIGNTKIIYQDTMTALAAETNNMSMPC